MKSNRIIAVHLLNDWSGSPLVFRQALEALHQSGANVTLFTATPSGSGFLSQLAGVTTHEIPYKWHPVKLVTLWYYLTVQLRLFLKLLFFLRRTDCVYVNTLLPVGAALAGWLRRCRVVYHVHEVSIKPRLLKHWLTGIANLTAQEVLFVSNYTLQQTALSRPSCRLIYNALPDAFTQQASRIAVPDDASPFTVLMLCSNKIYKGVNDFVDLARRLPNLRFTLVLNAKPDAVDTFIRQTAPPANCVVFPAQADTIPFYRQAHVVLNLSHPDAWVETFGMTILEAMTCGRPVVVPPVGGICELINEEKEGFKISVQQPFVLVRALRQLSSDRVMYGRMAEAAHKRADSFSSYAFQTQLCGVFDNWISPTSNTSDRMPLGQLRQK